MKKLFLILSIFASLTAEATVRKCWTCKAGKADYWTRWQENVCTGHGGFSADSQEEADKHCGGSDADADAADADEEPSSKG